MENIAVKAGDYVGGLVGLNEGGPITSCYTASPVSGALNVGGLVGFNEGGTVKSCYATGEVINFGNAGGLVGYNANGTITLCYATGAVTGPDNIGGLVGFNDEGMITSCYATGEIAGTNESVGGLVGRNANGTIMSCYTKGVVTGTAIYVGGLVGYNCCEATSITSCFAIGPVMGRSNIGGLLGFNAGTVTSCYWDRDTSRISTSEGGEVRTTDEMTYPYASNTYARWDFTLVWAADTDCSKNNGYPYLLDNMPSPESEGVWGKEISISSIEEFQRIGNVGLSSLWKIHLANDIIIRH